MGHDSLCSKPQFLQLARPLFPIFLESVTHATSIAGNPRKKYPALERLGAIPGLAVHQAFFTTVPLAFARLIEDEAVAYSEDLGSIMLVIAERAGRSRQVAVKFNVVDEFMRPYKGSSERAEFIWEQQLTLWPEVAAQYGFPANVDTVVTFGYQLNQAGAATVSFSLVRDGDVLWSVSQAEILQAVDEARRAREEEERRKGRRRARPGDAPPEGDMGEAK